MIVEYRFRKKEFKDLNDNFVSLQKNFLTLNIKNVVDYYTKSDSSQIDQDGFQIALELFHQAAERVPAYKDFLKKNSIAHKKVVSYADFELFFRKSLYAGTLSAAW